MPSAAPEPLAEDCPPAPVPDGALVREVRILNKKGLHARASAKFVQTVERFGSEVAVTRCGETVGGRSIMGLLTLAAAQGTLITVTAVGDDAEACLGAVCALVGGRFGEEDSKGSLVADDDLLSVNQRLEDINMSLYLRCVLAVVLL